MYCKFCGKEISDDSIYCKYCGRLQDVQDIATEGTDSNTSAEKNTENIQPPDSFWYRWYKNLTRKQLVLFWLYVIWFIINLALLASGDKDHDGEGFFPFHDRYYGRSIETYGISEFIIYAVLLPLLILLFSTVFRKDNDTAAHNKTEEKKTKAVKEIDPERPVKIVTAICLIFSILCILALVIPFLIYIFQ